MDVYDEIDEVLFWLGCSAVVVIFLNLEILLFGDSWYNLLLYWFWCLWVVVFECLSRYFRGEGKV